MNKYQAIAILVAAINLLLMLLFPPYDFINAFSNVPNFEGFLFAFGEHPNRVVNNDFLSIEIFTVLINAVIGYLLLHERVRLQRRLDRRNLVLLAIALNLLLALLFPPFQDHYIASKAIVPSFDDFYFVFGDNSKRVIVAAMLWVEVVFILINGALSWLFFCQPAPQAMTAAQRFAQPAELLRKGPRRKSE
jgi:hypothetical protein